MAALPADIRPETGPRKALPPQFRRTLVEYRTKEPVGTIIIDTPNTYLYLVLGNGKAMRYGVGVGREGFTWSGAEKVTKMAEWPDWNPPPEMIERQPYLPRFMAGGEGNPLGARALYLGKTIYRIHGTNQPSTIGIVRVLGLHPAAPTRTSRTSTRGSRSARAWWCCRAGRLRRPPPRPPSHRPGRVPRRSRCRRRRHRRCRRHCSRAEHQP